MQAGSLHYKGARGLSGEGLGLWPRELVWGDALQQSSSGVGDSRSAVEVKGGWKYVAAALQESIIQPV